MSNYLTCDVMRLCESFYKSAQLQKSCGHGAAGYLSSFFKTPPPPHPRFVIKLIITLGCLWAFIPVGMYSESLTSSFLTDAHTQSRTLTHKSCSPSWSTHLVSLWVFWGLCFQGHNRAAGPNDSRTALLRMSKKYILNLISDSEAIIHSRKLVPQMKEKHKVHSLSSLPVLAKHGVLCTNPAHGDASRERLREKQLLQGRLTGEIRGNMPSWHKRKRIKCKCGNLKLPNANADDTLIMYSRIHFDIEKQMNHNTRRIVGSHVERS